MVSIPNHEDIDVVILCGGLGTRLRSAVNDRPKAMAEIKNRPFLDILIDYIGGYRFKRFILCVGYMGDVIKKYYGEKNSDPAILFSEEKELMGTAGAIKNAEVLIRSNPFLVVNGDSFCEIDIKKFLYFHVEKKASISVALVSPGKEADYGIVALNDNKRVTSFNEKGKPDNKGFINTGIYFFNRDVLELIPVNIKYSLEYDLFPNILDKGIYGFITEERLIDIGTPERYSKAEKILSRFI